MHNQAFIDGQNLSMNTRKHGWGVNLYKFRIYLKEKYNVETAYYFVGSIHDEYQRLYENIQKAGFVLMFRAHMQGMTSKKKGNVDTDIVFTIMSKLVEKEKFNKVILVSGDGDYFKMVEYLITKNKFAKLLAPNRKSTSSLYCPYNPEYITFLDDPGVKKKIQD